MSERSNRNFNLPPGTTARDVSGPKYPMCPKCGKNPSKLDACPYDEDVNDTKRECDCCDECRHECLMDI